MTKQEALTLLDKLQAEYKTAGEVYFNGRTKLISARNSMVKAWQLLEVHIEFMIEQGWFEDNETSN